MTLHGSHFGWLTLLLAASVSTVGCGARETPARERPPVPADALDGDDDFYVPSFLK